MRQPLDHGGRIAILVQAAHDQLAGEFGRHAFRLRGVEAVTSGVLGVELRDGWAQLQVSKVILLREALNRLSAPHCRIAGHARKEVLVHILAASLLGRGAIQRACSVSAEMLENSCGVIWDSVRYELWAMSAMRPLAVGER